MADSQRRTSFGSGAHIKPGPAGTGELKFAPGSIAPLASDYPATAHKRLIWNDLAAACPHQAQYPHRRSGRV